MDIKDIIKTSPIEKAPEGFSDRIMLKIEAEKLYSKPKNKYELLSKSQILLLFALVLLPTVLAIVFSTGENSNYLITVKSAFTRLSNFFYEKFAVVPVEVDFMSILLAVSIFFIAFMILDLLFRKGLHLSLKAK